MKIRITLAYLKKWYKLQSYKVLFAPNITGHIAVIKKTIKATVGDKYMNPLHDSINYAITLQIASV